MQEQSAFPRENQKVVGKSKTPLQADESTKQGLQQAPDDTPLRSLLMVDTVWLCATAAPQNHRLYEAKPGYAAACYRPRPSVSQPSRVCPLPSATLLWLPILLSHSHAPHRTRHCMQSKPYERFVTAAAAEPALIHPAKHQSHTSSHPTQGGSLAARTTCLRALAVVLPQPGTGKAGWTAPALHNKAHGTVAAGVQHPSDKNAGKTGHGRLLGRVIAHNKRTSQPDSS